MAARAMWKGVIRFGGQSLPVKLYAALQDSKVHFRLLHAKDRVPVAQKMVNPQSNEEVPAADIRRGVQIDEGMFVILEAADLERVAPPASRDISVLRFVDRDAIGDLWFDRPYFLGPDPGAETAYWSFLDALEREGKQAVVRWVMRGKEYVGALRVGGDHLMLVTLRFAEQVVPASQIDVPEAAAASKKEIEMARQLVKALDDEFEPERYQDTYSKRLADYIDKKAHGRTVELRRTRRKPATRSLTAALEKSLAAARKQRRSA